MSTRKRNRFLEEFIEIYKSEPSIWKVKCKEYHDRPKRDAAYAKLLAKLKEVESDAVKETVVKKINNLRCSVRKEKKKYEASIRSGASTDDVYKPTLWYYNLFDFLEDQDTPRTSICKLDYDERTGSDEENLQETHESLPYHDVLELTYDDEASTQSTPNTNELALHKSRPNKNKKNRNDDLTKDVLDTMRDHLKRPQTEEDRYDLMGKTVAIRVRGLEKRQRLIAEKMINDILFEAEMGNLTTQSYRHTSGYMDHQLRPSFASGSENPSSN